MAVLTALAVFVTAFLMYPVNGVKVEGNRMFPAVDVLQAVPDHASLLTLNTGHIKREVASDPWVEGVEISRDWNSGIVTVKVQERSAVLDTDLGGRRIVLAVDGTELPGLGGAKLKSVRLDGDQLKNVLEAGRVLQSNGVRLNSVDGSNAGGIEATIKGRPVVFSGVVRDGQARALPDIMNEHPDAPYFDLRSPGRVVVGERDG